LVYFWVIWYVFSRIGMLQQEESGNPDSGRVFAHNLGSRCTNKNFFIEDAALFPGGVCVAQNGKK
jgi:hypothetical protein